MIRLLTASAFCLFLAGCGSSGGGGGGTPVPNPVPPNPPTNGGGEVINRKLLYGYFGDSTTQVGETKDHVNCHFVASWYSDNSTEDARAVTMNAQIANLKAAKAAGLTFCFLTVDYCLFESGNSKLLNSPVEISRRLKKLFQLLVDSEVADVVKILYLLDEPNPKTISNGDMRLADTLAKSTFFETTGKNTVRSAVIYANLNSNKVGIEYPDWVGFDDYDLGESAFTDQSLAGFFSQMASFQRCILVPGGADPYRLSPAVVYQQAQVKSQVVCILPFIWLDNYGYKGFLGIHSNSQNAAYVGVGTAIKAANPNSET